MRYLNNDYVQGEIINTISLMQQNTQSVPILENIHIDNIAERFVFQWKEIGDYEADFERTLLEFLRDEFIYNKINYTFNG